MSGETLLERTQRAITTGHLLDPGDTVVVAVSGGADSVALLAALALLAAPLGVTLHVAHLDHGLRPDSADDAAFVADLARGHSLPVTIAVADVAGYADEHGLSLEEAGRAARYAFLGALAATLGARRIATAHHADDQAETVLARLLRGAGVDGLGGMRPLAALPPTAAVPFTVRYTDLDRLIEATPLSVDARVIRPLLGLRRHELRGYAAARGLAFRDDPTNQDTTLLRNYLRHEILPLLATVNPAIVETLARTATLMADDADVLHALTEAVWSDVARSRADTVELDLVALAAQPVAMRRRLVREAIARLGSGRDVGAVHIERAVALAAEGAPGEQAHLPDGVIVARGYDTLTVSRGAPPDPDGPLLAPGAPPVPVAVPGVTAMGEWRLEISERGLARGESVERGAWSVERGAWGVGRGAWGVGRGARSVGRGAWGAGRGARGVGRGAWGAGRGARGVGRGARSVERGARSVERGAWSVERGAWSVGRRPESREGELEAVVWEEVVDARVAAGGLWLRGRLPGESFAPLGMGGRHRSLHDFMIDRRVPRHVRDRVPLLVNAEGVVWVVGLRLDERARVTADTASVLHLRIARNTAA